MTALRPLLALAWRESRFARRRLLLFLSAISLGVGALVATQSFASGLAAGVREQARALLGADVGISSNRPFPEATRALLDSLEAAGVPTAEMTTFSSMALSPATGGTRLAQVRAVEPGFPFYGEIETAPAGRWAELDAGRNALVDPGLLTALGMQVGDSLSLGEARFRVIGTLEKVPGDLGVGTLFAPRLYIPASRVEETRLLRFGSRADYEAFLSLPHPDSAAALVEARREAFRADRVRARTADEQQQQLDRALGRLGSFLGLIGTFALLLGGIGVASAMGAYMAQKRETVATLRCLGATSRQVLVIYLAQAGVMGVAGALLGALLGAATQWVLPLLLTELLPVEVAARVDGAAVLTGVGVGIWIALAFALLPLLAARRVSPLEAIRRRLSSDPLPGSGRDVWAWGARALLAASVLALVSLQAGGWRMGLGFLAGIAATLLGLWAAAWAVARLLRALRTGGLPYPLRQGLANLHRPGNQTRVVVLSLGFGVFLLATLFLVQDNLLAPLRPATGGERANLVFFDVQEDQEPGLDSILRQSGVRVLQRDPIIPMRVASINGKTVAELAPLPADGAEPPPADGPPGQAEEGEGAAPEGWALRREYRSTYRDTLVASERVLEGSFWSADYEPAAPGEPYPVSLERDIASDLRVGIGDTITWDVQGVRIPTTVASIREVDWRRLEPNFFAVFPSRALRGAPQTWVVLTRAEPAVRTVVQAQVVGRFSNVAAVDLTLVQQALDEVLGQVATVIRFLAAFSVATGFIVLLGAILTSRLQRVRESVLLRTLGASRRQIGAILLAEYFALGLAAALAGSVLAVGGGWALAKWVFEVDYAVPVPPLVVLGAVMAVLAAAVGFWASREVFRQTPLEMLREE